MIDDVLVSIIINNYNYERYLKRAIQSALLQTYSNIELIIIDDGSTDGSNKILKNYQDKATIKIKQNGGQVSAVNEGYSIARGDLIIFLDSDDMLKEEMCEKVVSIYKENKADTISKIQYYLEVIDKNDSKKGGLYPPFKFPEKDDVRKLVVNNIFYPASPTSGNVYTRYFLDQIMPLKNKETEAFSYADIYLNTMAPFYGLVLSINSVLGFYRLHGENIMTNERLRFRPSYLLLKIRCDEAMFKAAYHCASVEEKPQMSLRKYSLHIRLLLLLMKIDKDSYPYKNDTSLSLALQGTKAVFYSSYFTYYKKLSFIVFLWAGALLPAFIFKRIFMFVDGFNKMRLNKRDILEE